MERSAGFLADTHIHSRFSQDSESKISDICAAAKAKNIAAICITDHADIIPGNDLQKLIQDRRDILQVAQQTETEVELLVGIELACGGFYPQNGIFEEMEKTLLSIGHYDCVIGSVHRVGNVSTARNDYSAMSHPELLGCLSRYFDAILSMLEHSKPDILAHMTYPLRYINGKYGRQLDWRELQPRVEQILKLLIQKSIALEVNTSCLGTYYDALMPEEGILQLYLQMGGKLLTLGSDAHKPENIGKDFDKTVALLKQMGVKELQYVKNRQLRPYKI